MGMFIYSLDMKLLSDTCIGLANILFHFMCCLFIIFIVSFNTSIFSFRLNLSIFLLLVLLVLYSRNYCKIHKSISPIFFLSFRGGFSHIKSLINFELIFYIVWGKFPISLSYMWIPSCSNVICWIACNLFPLNDLEILVQNQCYKCTCLLLRFQLLSICLYFYFYTCTTLLWLW